jgi:single-stranded DNA-binding protein
MSKRSPGCLADMWEFLSSVGVEAEQAPCCSHYPRGDIVADLELTDTPSGKPVVRFPVLVNRRRKDPDTEQWCDGEPTRHACVAFGMLGEHLADSLTRGDRILVVGSVTDAWDDKGTGHKRTAQRGW